MTLLQTLWSSHPFFLLRCVALFAAFAVVLGVIIVGGILLMPVGIAGFLGACIYHRIKFGVWGFPSF